MPSSRRRPFRKSPEGEDPPRRPSSRRSGSERRGVSSRERSELFSDPPEHADGEELDSIGLSEGRRRRGSSRRRSERTGRRGSEREAGAGVARSKREKQNWARRKVKKLVPLGILLGVIILVLVCLQIPGWIRSGFMNELASADIYTRENAALNLSEPAAAPGLQARLENDKFEEAGGAAAVALAGIDPRRSDAGLDALAAACASNKVETRLAAAHGLGLYGQPAAVEALAKLLKGDEDKVVRVQAARSLGMIRSPKSVEALISQADAQKEVRDAAVVALLTAACPEARDQLVQGLGSGSRQMREACRRALIATEQDKQVSEADVRKLLTSAKPEVRAGAIGFMALSGKGDAFAQAVKTALDDKSETVRTAAVEAAGLRRFKPALGKLERMVVEEKDSGVRAAVARALGLLQKLSSVVPLAKVLADGSAPETVRLAAADALVAVCNPKANPFRRPVGQFEEGERAAHLSVAIKEPDLRWKAVEVLVAGCPGFKSDELKTRGYAAMKAVCGRKLGPKPEIWQAWYQKKMADARVLGRISALVEEAYQLKKQKQETPAYNKMEAAMRLSKALLKKADPADLKYFQGLFGDLCGKIGKKPKDEIKVVDPEPKPKPKPDAGKEEKSEEDKKPEK